MYLIDDFSLLHKVIRSIMSNSSNPFLNVIIIHL